MTSPVDAKAEVLKAVATDIKAWVRRSPEGYREKAANRFVSLAENALPLPSAVHLGTAEGHIVMALAWRAKGSLKDSIPKARAWLKGELEEAARQAMAAAEPLEDRRPGRESA